MSKGAKNVAKDIKAGFKNIKNVYQTLYNRPGPGGGSKTVKNNVDFIVNGPKVKPIGGKGVGGKRVALAALGASSVTPLGPVVAFAAGVNKSVKDRQALKAVRAGGNRVGGTAPKTTAPKTTAPKVTAKTTAPKTTTKTTTKTVGKSTKK